MSHHWWDGEFPRTQLIDTGSLYVFLPGYAVETPLGLPAFLKKACTRLPLVTLGDCLPSVAVLNGAVGGGLWARLMDALAAARN